MAKRRGRKKASGKHRKPAHGKKSPASGKVSVRGKKKARSKRLHRVRPKVVRAKPRKQPVKAERPEKAAKKETFLKRLKRKRKAREEESGSELTRDQTPMRIYLDQIEQIPLLNPKQELEVARRIKRKGKDSDVARELMIRSNLRLVISIAKRYANIGLTFSDLVEEGNIGLMRAVDKFDPDRGYRFSTYASWWIKQAIMRALSNQGKTIRIPVYMFDIVSRYRRIRDELVQRLSRVPTREEIAQILKVPVAKVIEIEGVVNRPSSLHTAVSLDGSAELIDLIEDDSFETPLQETEELLRHERIQKLLTILDDRERRILELRYGLGNEKPHTLEETAQQFGITRERVRQIEAAALKKIRYQMATEADKPEDYLT